MDVFFWVFLIRYLVFSQLHISLVLHGILQLNGFLMKKIPNWFIGKTTLWLLKSEPSFVGKQWRRVCAVCGKDWIGFKTTCVCAPAHVHGGGPVLSKQCGQTLAYIATFFSMALGFLEISPYPLIDMMFLWWIIRIICFYTATLLSIGIPVLQKSIPDCHRAITWFNVLMWAYPEQAPACGSRRLSACLRLDWLSSSPTTCVATWHCKLHWESLLYIFFLYFNKWSSCGVNFSIIVLIWVMPDNHCSHGCCRVRSLWERTLSTTGAAL